MAKYSRFHKSLFLKSSSKKSSRSTSVSLGQSSASGFVLNFFIHSQNEQYPIAVLVALLFLRARKTCSRFFVRGMSFRTISVSKKVHAKRKRKQRKLPLRELNSAQGVASRLPADQSFLIACTIFPVLIFPHSATEDSLRGLQNDPSRFTHRVSVFRQQLLPFGLQNRSVHDFSALYCIILCVRGRNLTAY